MTILPVCSATTSCSSSHCQIPLNGGLRSFYSPRKDFESRISIDSASLGSPSGKSPNKFSFKAQAMKFSTGDIDSSVDQSVLNSLVRPSNESYSFEKVNLRFVDYQVPVTEEKVMDFKDQSVDIVTTLPQSVEVEGITGADMAPELPTFTSEPQLMDSSSSSELKTSVEDIVSGFTDSSSESLKLEPPTLTSEPQFMGSSSPSELKTNVEDTISAVSDSLNSSIEKGQRTLSSSLDSINSSIASVIKSATDTVENITSTLFSTVDQMGESAGNRMTNVSSDFRQTASKAGVIAVDILRSAIVSLEDSAGKGASFVVYSYSSAKELLPSELRDTLDLTEEKTAEILKPVGAVTQQVSFAIEQLERTLGLDPSDPVVSFVLLLGSASTLWAFYWVRTYSGYSGDLSPKLTFQLLTGKDKAVLIDIRPEVFRENDGIPDLRRTARFRYSSVSLPEVDGSIRKLLKSGRDVEDGLLAAVIRNLKIVEDRSKVIIMDVDGTRSKGIARSLRKLGVKQPYLVEGGFQSWVSQGLRIKELKPETALTVLNEEAEAILEEINPSPFQVFASGVGLITALYALVEWEKTLQLIGIFGISLTVYLRFASYQDPEDFKQDLRQLLVPVKYGADAFSWAAGKLETNGIGLPTSPSSSDVQNRVLQAAARHESQPSKDEGAQEFSSEPVSPSSERGDLSEA